jgi:hypothetical protein
MSKELVKKEGSKGIGDRLDSAPYHKICTELWEWRIGDFIRGREGERKEGKILAFVRGLHFSAQLIYAIRELIPEETTSLKVDWGHLLDKSGRYCSRECDIIIHKGRHARWNGNDKPIMNFKFVKQENAVAVISCKSYLKSGDVDKKYVGYLKPFVKKIWLFAECCEPKQVTALTKQAQQAGYQNFWYMYEWSRDTDSHDANEGSWQDFAKKLRKLTP